MRPLLLVLLVFLVAVPVAAAQEPPIATIPNVTPLRALGDTLVWSTRGPGEQDPYRLTVRSGGVNHTPPLRSFDDAGDFDVGTDASGTPLLVYIRCKPGCDVYTAALDGTGEKRIAGASSPHYDESAPTLSRGLLAFARKDVVYERRLTASTNVRSRRVLTVPRLTCPYGPKTCARTRLRSIDELELDGQSLGVIMNFVEPEGASNGRTEVRYADLRRGSVRVRTLRGQSAGEGGQTLLGVSFAGGKLGFALSCFGDPGGCGYGAHRFTPATGLLERTTQASQLNGFSLAGASGDQAYVLTPADGSEAGEDETCPCQISQRDVGGWRPIR